ncbi:hypothetical protein [Tenacibaculum ovolyticum]|uniref:hypothetical protein n=1 Tax=Tenacibaculum ovolyticum TaxID=104270 RepID=UPI000AB8BD9A|nr:hypothetical protein [Tenacibaculum ovolyticum]
MSENHGGKRKGAGRKPKDTKQLCLKVPSEIIKGLDNKFPTAKERNGEIVKALKKLIK